MLTLRGKVRQAGRLTGAALIATGATMAWLGGGDVATAAEVTPSSIDITTTSPVDPGERIRTDMTFCVPDATASGDTFSVQLPSELEQLPSGFTLDDPDGMTVAEATISGVPAVVTFTFTSYVDDRVDVCGSAFFESELSSSVTPNSVITLEFIVSGGAIIEVDVTTGTPDVGTDRTTARKSGVFTDNDDQCRTTLTNCINWFIESRPGPFTSVRIEDDGLTDATFDCATLTVRFWTLLPDGSRDSSVSSPGSTVTPLCSPTSLDVTITDVPTDVIVRTLISATPATADPGGGVLFVNPATVTQTSLTVDVDDVIGQVRSSEVGGEASGVTPTTTAATTTVVSSTTTLPGGGSGGVTPTPAPVTLPATGLEGGGGAATALLLVAAGAALMFVARRSPEA